MQPCGSALRLRVFGGGFGTETNVFSPMRTGLEDYAVAEATADESVRDRILFGSSFRRYAARAAARGCTFVQGFYAFALPGGLTSRRPYEILRRRLLDEIRLALPLDAVILTLHGAMVAAGYDDCETDLVERVRAVVGTRTKIGLLLDPHCDLPDALVDSTDVIVLFREYPHVDIDECAAELFDLVVDGAAGLTTPVMATSDCGMMGVYPTTQDPMRAFVDERLRAARSREGVLSASLAHGFPWGDAPAMGARTLVVSDRDRSLAQRCADDLARTFFALRHHVTLAVVGMHEALDAALSRPTRPGPVVIADMADNPGAGAASDSTFVLRELLDRRASDVGMSLMWDPSAVRLAVAAGVGAQLDLRLGGKVCSSSGEPLKVNVRVRGVVRDLVQRWPQLSGFVDVPCGDVVWVSCDGVDIIMSTIRQQPVGLELFTDFGIDPRRYRVLVLKSMIHFHAAYAPIASEVVYMAAPGALVFDPREIPYRSVDRRKFPWLEDPWQE